MAKHSHLTLEQRYIIEHSLNRRLSFKAIARELQKDCTTVSKEIKSHRVFKKIGAHGRAFNDCLHRSDCDVNHLCTDCSNERLHFCKSCKKCSSVCPQYAPQPCHLLKRPPYVCNGCIKRQTCRLEKALYDARDAQKEYELIRSESRSGINISEPEVLRLDRLISPLIQKGQSIHHIYANNRDQIMCSEKTIYNYVDYNLLSARNVDLPRKVRYHLRKKITNYFKVDKTCRIGRSYHDFLAFTFEHPDIPVVEMDSVIGSIGGKVLLTLHFVQPQLMLAYLRDANDSKSVIDIFDKLYLGLQPDLFRQLFPLLLCDNGSEFTNPKAIEYDRQNNKRTSIFYCDPLAPYQKGAAENNHEFIRRILPKGSSFDHLSQEDIDLMMYHINSYGRNKLGDKSPYQAFEFLYGESALKKIGYKIIAPNDIILQPSLLKNKH